MTLCTPWKPGASRRDVEQDQSRRRTDGCHFGPTRPDTTLPEAHKDREDVLGKWPTLTHGVPACAYTVWTADGVLRDTSFGAIRTLFPRKRTGQY